MMEEPDNVTPSHPTPVESPAGPDSVETVETPEAASPPAEIAAAPAEAPASPSAETPAAPALTLSETLLQKLDEAAAPLKFGDVKKGLTKAKKQSKEDFEAEIRQSLDESAQAGRVFKYPSGPKGEERYWSKDERHAIREEGLRLAQSPAPLPDLVKQGRSVSNADAAFVESALRELVAEERLFEHPPKKKNGPPLFGTERYRSPNDRPVVTEALLAAASTPQAQKDLVKSVAATTLADKEFVESVLDEIVAEKQLHVHPSRKADNPLLGRQPPPPPPHPLEIEKHQKALDKLAKEARKLLHAAGVSADDLLHRLRPLLEDRGAGEPTSPDSIELTPGAAAVLGASPAPLPTTSSEDVDES